MDAQNLAELVFSEKYRRTADDKNFILYDSGSNEVEPDHRIVIFGTDENMEFLSRCDGWYMDGTFKIVPRLFTQLYTIHGNI